MSVCLFAYRKNHTFKLHEVFCTCYLGPWLDPLTTMEYVMYFRYVDGVMFSHNGRFVALGVGNIDVTAVLDTKYSQLVINFQRTPRWRHIAWLCRRTQWQQTAHRGRSLLSTIALLLSGVWLYHIHLSGLPVSIILALVSAIILFASDYLQGHSMCYMILKILIRVCIST